MAAPRQIKASENDELNKPFTLPNFCAPAGTVGGYVTDYLDKAREYKYVGEGDGTCRYCSLAAPHSVNCAAGCADVSCCSIIGKTANFARTNYKGDKEACCMGGPRIDPEGRTCHPDHVSNNEKCRTILLNNCNENPENYLIEGTACNDYTTFFPEGTFLKCKACNDYDIFTKHEDLCKKLCLQNPGWCDDASNTYCKGSNSTYCACINNDSSNNPICTNADCRSLGYVTNGIKDIDCIINNCKVDLSFDNIRNLDINQLEIQQQCGGGDGDGGGGGSSSGNGGDQQQQQQQQQSIQTKIKEFFYQEDNIPLVIGFLVIVLILLLYYTF
uniref:Pox virus entry-fusion-complex G9/A16 n=1 Tax=Carcinus maenas virus 1 TaxID=2704945 RepID=A0A6G9HDX4_9VIRU|nr:Pox virus entry-fusion-complex G9/A16 [Carcinus maenas virus 1]